MGVHHSKPHHAEFNTSGCLVLFGVQSVTPAMTLCPLRRDVDAAIARDLTAMSRFFVTIGQTRFDLDIDQSTSILAVKQMLAARSLGDPCNMRIVCAGAELSDDMNALAIAEQDSSVRVFFRAAAGQPTALEIEALLCSVNVSFLNQSRAFTCLTSDTIGDFRARMMHHYQLELLDCPVELEHGSYLWQDHQSIEALYNQQRQLGGDILLIVRQFGSQLLRYAHVFERPMVECTTNPSTAHSAAAAVAAAATSTVERVMSLLPPELQHKPLPPTKSHTVCKTYYQLAREILPHVLPMVREEAKSSVEFRFMNDEQLVAVLLLLTRLLRPELAATLATGSESLGIWEPYMQLLLGGLRALPQYLSRPGHTCDTEPLFAYLVVPRDSLDCELLHTNNVIEWKSPCVMCSSVGRAIEIAKERIADDQRVLLRLDCPCPSARIMPYFSLEMPVVTLPCTPMRVKELVYSETDPSRVVAVHFEEIPAPRTVRPLLWVDDCIDRIRPGIVSLERCGHPVMFCDSTSKAYETLERFPWSTRCCGFQVVTNMARVEADPLTREEKQNDFAGLELIRYLRDKLRYGGTIYVFCSDPRTADVILRMATLHENVVIIAQLFELYEALAIEAATLPSRIDAPRTAETAAPSSSSTSSSSSSEPVVEEVE